MRPFLKGLIAAIVVAAGFLCGFGSNLLEAASRDPRSAISGIEILPAKLAIALRPASAIAQGDDDLQPVSTYFAVMSTIRNDYIGAAPSQKKMTYAAIRGMLRTLNDPYTVFWTPEEYRKQMEETRGDFSGIGATLNVTKDKKVYIEEPIENSPAMRKGLLAGDVLMKVDGRPIAGQDLSAVIDRIRGKEGTPVTLTIQRQAVPKPFDVTIVRGVVHSPVIRSWMLDDAAKVGYISLNGFNEQADRQFAEAVRRLEARGMKALIFDLRNNPGGLLTVAQDIASRFVHDGPVVWVQEKNGRQAPLNVENNKHESQLDTGSYPLAVLVNGYSASASEIVAGAIHDHKVGTLVGTTTFGKGLVQTIIPLPDQSAVKITTQHYFTPNKIDINKKVDAAGKVISGGIKPDYVVELSDSDVKAILEARQNDPRDLSKDPQAMKALEIVKSQIVARSEIQTTER